jgi:hypothetical protein
LLRAAQQLGIDAKHQPVDCERLSQAVADYRSLFRPTERSVQRYCRETALTAMRDLAVFEPRLTGHLVDGLGPLNQITLIVEAETSEEVARTLIDRRMAYREDDYRLQHGRTQRVDHPAFRFEAGDCEVTLVVLGRPYRANPPHHPLCGSPMRLVSASELAAQLATDSDASDL